MGNRNTTQKSSEQKQKDSTISTSFQVLNDSFTPLANLEHNQHIITSAPFQILKDLSNQFSQSQCVLYKHEILICECYSYHTLKNEYKFICKYPSAIKLHGHCVVKLINNNEITLLSFGGLFKHTLIMKYVSIWSDISKKLNNHNEWIPFTDNHNHPIIIGRDEDDYWWNVFDLNIFQFIKHDILSTDDIFYQIY
ncbi:hypothetical protein RFI_22274 [Reticulomyxa filosa]|uniref:Uncharacterized protein n=1 Tax=Reticulomyxa filosa TaxID=46433 RepID=X6MPR8_RETFI|nr:hypothetical protein RFI_22274 [Reticulomyxa filosa]|eukprot:ETO15090.1 hypothetical protein RFI_22274 [Reticulomyxa filosa]